MEGEPLKKPEESPGRKIGRNLLNIGLFFVKVLILILAGPPLVKFFSPVIVGWVIAQIANPPVQFMEKKLQKKQKKLQIVYLVVVQIQKICLVVM